MASRNAIGWIAALLLPFVSCGKPPEAVRPVEIDAAASADRMLQQYDSDGNGALSSQEATACSGLAPIFDRYDTNQNGEAERDEIAARFRKWTTDEVGIMRVGCSVTLDGEPLSGARVVLEPHPFLGDVLKPAAGTTMEYGQCSLSVAPDDLPASLQRVRGVQPGFYLVRITHAQIDVPAMYNADTTIGLEVAADAIDPDGVAFRLTSR